jgi:hypothetical protein
MTSLPSLAQSIALNRQEIVYGRTCDVCTLNFMTEDPKVCTCEWCQKVEETVNPAASYGKR